ncbi:MAG: phosphatidate cytidylyltransferase [Chloroflexi bacterium]|nr:phosphatidate cytidylyltransferase [Chloroflexota bacterium]
MLAKRLLVLIFLIPVFVALLVAGGWIFATFIALILGIAAWEYWRIFKGGGHSPSKVVLVGGVVLLALSRAAFGFHWSDAVLTGLILLTLAVSALRYERGIGNAATDFTITVGGFLYLGWLGAYFISLRALPQGQWWTLFVISSIWIVDAGAYVIGSRFGRHLLAPRVSPHKTWEGFAGGLVLGMIGTALLAALWQSQVAAITPQKGLFLGLVLGVISPLGDLGESMFKRQFGLKDSGKLLPGHGGVMDRIDTWLWAVSVSYYLIVWLW